MQQLSSLWDDYQSKVNEQLNVHITSYASHFPEVKVSHYIPVISYLSDVCHFFTMQFIACKQVYTIAIPDRADF